MRNLFLSNILILLASTGIAQKITFVEQEGVGFWSGIKANAVSEKGNGAGFGVETTIDVLLHDLVGLGFGLDIHTIRLNNTTQALTPLFADFKIVARGKFRPYLIIDPGYCFYYSNNVADNKIQKGSFYMGGGAGVWLPSKRTAHLFLQTKYNYTRILTSPIGYPEYSSGSIGTFSFLVGLKF